MIFLSIHVLVASRQHAPASQPSPAAQRRSPAPQPSLARRSRPQAAGRRPPANRPQAAGQVPECYRQHLWANAACCETVAAATYSVSTYAKAVR